MPVVLGKDAGWWEEENEERYGGEKRPSRRVKGGDSNSEKKDEIVQRWRQWRKQNRPGGRNIKKSEYNTEYKIKIKIKMALFHAGRGEARPGTWGGPTFSS